MKDAVRDPAELCRLLELPAEFWDAARDAAGRFPLFVPRGFVARMRPGDAADPLLRQVLPLADETVDVPGFVSLIGEKRYAEALSLHRDRNPFASVCARVCFHTCEDKCRRAGLDEAVAIRSLKRFMTEQEVTVQLPDIRDSEENAKRKIAIIGAGPAGLSCAYFLARLG